MPTSFALAKNSPWRILEVYESDEGSLFFS
jgi:hypothetical protein